MSSNQYKPLPPDDWIFPIIQQYWKQRKNDKEILEIVQQRIDRQQYGIGYTSFRKIRKRLGFLRTRQQGHTLESIRPAILRLRLQFPKSGAREMCSLLFHEYGYSVSRHLVMEYFHRFEPQLVAERKSRRLKRRRFWAAGVNDLLAVDQHDKWQRFGLRLHTGIDPFIGRIQWLKVWYTNRNPRLISSYYLDFLEEFKHMPLVTQSDPGSENYGIANVTTALRHWHDPNLQGTLQHRWMRQKKNVMPEITWSQLRRRFTPGFEDILEIGVVNEWYDIGNPLDALLFRWIFIPWMQKELDAYRERVNNSKKRADRNKILPHGVPNDIFERPEHYGCLDFKISIEVEALDYLASQVYTGLGEPEIGRHNVWDIYLDMQDGLTRIANEDGYVDTFWEQIMQESDVTADFEEELLEGQTELLGGMDHPRTDGSYYMGGVNGGLGLDIENNCTLDELDMEGLDKESESEDDEEEIAEALVVEFSDDE